MPSSTPRRSRERCFSRSFFRPMAMQEKTFQIESRSHLWRGFYQRRLNLARMIWVFTAIQCFLKSTNAFGKTLPQFWYFFGTQQE